MPNIYKLAAARHTALAGALALLAACSGGGDAAKPAQANLHLACQTVECFCIDDRGGILTSPKRADVVWKDNGDASCAAGYRLKRVETDFLGRKN